MSPALLLSLGIAWTVITLAFAACWFLRWLWRPRESWNHPVFRREIQSHVRRFLDDAS